ncbi:MAG: hypothetical protein HZC28_16090 [Spirochaetes bacterium]|nr:hypothetical protein [Spirochaetota bacterium]
MRILQQILGLFTFRFFSYTTSLSPEETEKRFGEMAEKGHWYTGIVSLIGMHRPKLPFLGRVKNGRMNFKPNASQRSPLFPIINGRILPAANGGGSTVRVTCHVNLPVLIIPLIVLVPIFITNAEFYVKIVVTLLIYAIILAGALAEANNVRQTIERLLVEAAEASKKNKR